MIKILFGLTILLTCACCASQESQTYTNRIDSLSTHSNKTLFPLYGFTPGVTEVDDIRAMKFKCRTDGALTNCEVEDFTFWDMDNDGVCEQIYILSHVPYLWYERFGFSFDLSYNEWLQLLNGLFKVEIVEKPSIVKYEGRNTLKAIVNVYVPAESVKLVLEFSYGNDDDLDGFTEDSPRSLYSIDVYAWNPYADPESEDEEESHSDSDYTDEEEGDYAEDEDEAVEHDTTTIPKIPLRQTRLHWPP